MKKVFKIFQHKEVSLTDNYDSLDSVTSIIKIEQAGNFKDEAEALKEVESRLQDDPSYVLTIEPMWVSEVKYDDSFIF